jgi:tetratricopeptide (TPR) repeat protein
MDSFNLLMDSFPSYGKTLADYDKKRQLLPHLEAFLPHLDNWQNKEHELKVDKEKYCLYPLLINIADGYRSLGDAVKERELLERVLAIKERHYGLDHPEVAAILTNLGCVHASLGDTQKSRELLERALAIEERHFGLDYPEAYIIH